LNGGKTFQHELKVFIFSLSFNRKFGKENIYFGKFVEFPSLYSKIIIVFSAYLRKNKKENEKKKLNNRKYGIV
jgi:hypothetical protein